MPGHAKPFLTHTHARQALWLLRKLRPRQYTVGEYASVLEFLSNLPRPAAGQTPPEDCVPMRGRTEDSFQHCLLCASWMLPLPWLAETLQCFKVQFVSHVSGCQMLNMSVYM